MGMYMKCPSIRAWQMYYEYINTSKSYREVAKKFGVTGARVGQLVNKVRRYIIEGNTKIITKEMLDKHDHAVIQ